jgi:hypothetical protein
VFVWIRPRLRMTSGRICEKPRHIFTPQKIRIPFRKSNRLSVCLTQQRRCSLENIEEAQLRYMSNLAAGRTTSQEEQSAIEKQDEIDTGARETLANGALRASEKLYAEVRATMGLPPAKFYNLDYPQR